MGAGQQARPQAWLQYQAAADVNFGTIAGTTAIVDMATDRSSFANGLLDKPTNSRFRALRDCTVRVSFGAVMDTTGNDDGVEVRCLLNSATVVEQSRTGVDARASTAEPVTASKTFLVDLNANDYLELQGNKLEGGQTSTFVATGTSMLMELVRLR